VHGDAGFVPQIEAQMLGEGLDGGFGGVVRRVSGRVGDALLGAGDDHGGGPLEGRRGGGPDRREEGSDAVDDAEEVGGEDPLEGVDGGPRRRGAYACVEG